MKITDLLKKEGVALNLKPADKEAVIDIMVDLHDKVGNLNDKAAYKEAIKAREAQGSTAVGMGIAVPHAKTDAAKRPGLTAITVPDGIDYECADGTDSNLFFMIAAPGGAADTHLEVLAGLMTMLMDPEFSKSLVEAKTPEEFLALDESIRLEYAGNRPVHIVPADLEYTGEIHLDAGNCPIRVFQAPSPHTDDTTLIELPGEKVLFIGDSNSGSFPSWRKDPVLARELAAVIEAVDVPTCLEGHWVPDTKEGIIQDILAEE